MSASDLGAFSINVKKAFRGRGAGVGALGRHYHHTTRRHLEAAIWSEAEIRQQAIAEQAVPRANHRTRA